ncbi:MAG: exonuclease SbcCD subunit D [Ruminococcaceae bacterium]|nr:exonuclease SbcCD subunit D [Oscillospiraceae bacterium]
MRFLHTADLHIGKRVFDISLTDDQKAVLSQIADIAQRENCDAVLIAGDVYDRSSPPAEAMTAFSDFVSSLSEKGIPVYIIGGNHDSGERVDYMAPLLERSGVYFCGAFDGGLRSYKMRDAHGDVNIHLLPFVKPINVKRYFPDAEIQSYEQAIKTVLDNADVDFDSRNVLVAHQFITGGETCDSEEFAIGGLDNISASVFDGFDYVALGHLHGCQRVGRDTLRYSGSPIKYSFSEMNHKKSVTIVDIGEKGSTEIRTVPLTQPHDMRDVSGTLAELMSGEYSEDYVRVTVTDEDVAPDAASMVLSVYPNMMRFGVKNSKIGVAEQYMSAQDIGTKSISQLFCEFYSLRNNGVEPDGKRMKLLEEILAQIGDEQL